MILDNLLQTHDDLPATTLSHIQRYCIAYLGKEKNVLQGKTCCSMEEKHFLVDLAK